MEVCGEEGGRLAGRLAGSRDPPRRAKSEENPSICLISLNLEKIDEFH